MIRAAAFAITSSLLLAGCGAASVADNASDNAAQSISGERDDIAETKGWNHLFGKPEAVIVQAGQLGWRMPAYAKTDGGFASESAPAPLMSTGAVPIVSRFAIAGDAAEMIDRMRFSIDITDEGGAKKSTETFAKNVRSFFFLFKIDATAVETELVKAQAATGLLAGTPYVIDVHPLPATPNARRMTVTFTRPAGNAPAKQPQGT
ncbi:MAG: hypothetical protein EOP62_22510 [Sphingomonadales bacterium]|nr:MAG: hypothetical protein EOP62_22510 [Sphingomonadales bacterium]